MEIWYYSAIDKVDSRDYTKTLNKSTNSSWKVFKDIIYNQKEVSAYSCTTHWFFGMVSDITGLSFTKEVRLSAWNLQKKTGAVENEWDTFQNAIKQWTKVLQTIFWNKFYYYRAKLTEDNIKSIIDNEKSSIMTGNRGWLWKDARDDGIINESVVHKEWGGHCVRIIKYFYEDWKFKIKYCDNYLQWTEEINWKIQDTNHNIVTVPFDEYKKKFFEYGYFLEIV